MRSINNMLDESAKEHEIEQERRARREREEEINLQQLRTEQMRLQKELDRAQLEADRLAAQQEREAEKQRMAAERQEQIAERDRLRAEELERRRQEKEDEYERRRADREEDRRLREQENEQRRLERLADSERIRKERLEDAERIRRERFEEEQERKRLEEQEKALLEQAQFEEEERLANELPYQIEEILWYRHALALAMPGSGKTNLIRWRIKQLLDQLAVGTASLILIEPKGILTRELLTLSRHLGIEERVVLIDPFEAPVSVNLFDKGDGSPEQLENAIHYISRVLGTLTASFTEIQSSSFAMIVAALFSLPEEPTREKLTEIVRFGKAILPLDNLDYDVRAFFEHDYPEKGDTNILSRLRALFGSPVYQRLFNINQPSFDIGEEMQKGRIILINTGLRHIPYGSFWVQEVNRTLGKRFEILQKGGKLTPVTFVIDEAQTYIGQDFHFAQTLDLSREAEVGVFSAFQHMGQGVSDHVKNSLYAAALKFVARTNADVHSLCRSMGKTETSFISTVPDFQFAFHKPGMERALRFKIDEIKFPAARQEDFDHFKRESPVPAPVTPTVPPPSADPVAFAAKELDQAIEEGDETTIQAKKRELGRQRRKTEV